MKKSAATEAKARSVTGHVAARARARRGVSPLILEAEAEQEAANAAAHDPAIASDAPALQAALSRLQSAQAEVERLYARWAELEEKQKG